MRRRELLLMLTTGMIGTQPLRAQPKAIPVIGLLGSGSPFVRAGYLLAAFIHGLSETGYVEGQNVAIEYRFAEGHYDRLPALAADLVGRKVDLIFASGILSSRSRPKMLLRQSRSSSPATTTRSQRGWSPVSPGRAVT